MPASESKFKKAKYEDKPEFATIISGGMLFSAFFYWVSNNILSISQQWYITRQIEKAHS